MTPPPAGREPDDPATVGNALVKEIATANVLLYKILLAARLLAWSAAGGLVLAVAVAVAVLTR